MRKRGKRKLFTKKRIINKKNFGKPSTTKHVLDSSWAQRGNLFLNSPMTLQFRPQTTFSPTLDIYLTLIRSKSFRFSLPFSF